jgi:hypothetical protein
LPRGTVFSSGSALPSSGLAFAVVTPGVSRLVSVASVVVVVVGLVDSLL